MSFNLFKGPYSTDNKRGGTFSQIAENLTERFVQNLRDQDKTWIIDLKIILKEINSLLE